MNTPGYTQLITNSIFSTYLQCLERHYLALCTGREA